MTISDTLAKLDIQLPPAPTPVGSYVAATTSGNTVYTSGMLPIVDGALCCAGKIPGDVSVECGQTAARLAVLNGLAAIEAEIGSLDNIEKIIRINVFVNSSAGFFDQAAIANGLAHCLEHLIEEHRLKLSTRLAQRGTLLLDGAAAIARAQGVESGQAPGLGRAVGLLQEHSLLCHRIQTTHEI